MLAFLPLYRKSLIASKCRPSEPPRTLGERLKAWRLERGLEQRDVAAMLGVRPATYGRWERDQKRPAIQLMPRVLTLLGSDPSATRKSLPEERLLSARQLLGLTQAGLAKKLASIEGRSATGSAVCGFLPRRVSQRRGTPVARCREAGLNSGSCSRPTRRGSLPFCQWARRPSNRRYQ